MSLQNPADGPIEDEALRPAQDFFISRFATNVTLAGPITQKAFDAITGTSRRLTTRNDPELIVGEYLSKQGNVGFSLQIPSVDFPGEYIGGFIKTLEAVIDPKIQFVGDHSRDLEKQYFFPRGLFPAHVGQLYRIPLNRWNEAAHAYLGRNAHKFNSRLRSLYEVSIPFVFADRIIGRSSRLVGVYNGLLSSVEYPHPCYIGAEELGSPFVKTAFPYKTYTERIGQLNITDQRWNEFTQEDLRQLQDGQTVTTKRVKVQSYESDNRICDEVQFVEYMIRRALQESYYQFAVMAQSMGQEGVVTPGDSGAFSFAFKHPKEINNKWRRIFSSYHIDAISLRRMMPEEAKERFPYSRGVQDILYELGLGYYTNGKLKDFERLRVGFLRDGIYLSPVIELHDRREVTGRAEASFAASTRNAHDQLYYSLENPFEGGLPGLKS